MLTIGALTWNMHNTEILPSMHTVPDLLFISVQESFTAPITPNIHGAYPNVYKKALWGIRTILFSKKPVNCRFNTRGMGPLNFPNKGYVATVINDDILHINVHLTHSPARQKVRMAQIESILRWEYSPHYSTIIFTGDFNFRIHNNYDQGQDFIREYGPAFKEAKIDFLPTYKFTGNEYNPRRVPSYCDRVFVMTQHDLKFKQYIAMSQITASDHKPVYCLFSLSGERKESAALSIKLPDRRLADYLLDFIRILLKGTSGTFPVMCIALCTATIILIAYIWYHY